MKFEILIKRISAIEPHPDTDLLELAKIEGYTVVVRKGEYQANELVVYFQPDTIMSQELITKLNFRGIGAAKNRLGTMRLRGILSQGLIYKPEIWPSHWVESMDVQAEFPDTHKYEPEIPVNMQGKVTPSKGKIMETYDVENIKNFPAALREGELVIATEKLHGTCLIMHYNVETDLFQISSKGVAKRGLSLMEEENNLYWNVVRKFHLEEKVRLARDYLVQILDLSIIEICVYGEIIGVQAEKEMDYGLKNKQYEYRFFDIKIGFFNAKEKDNYWTEKWLDSGYLQLINTENILSYVPVVYEGEYNEELLQILTNGVPDISKLTDAEIKRFTPKTLIPNASHFREGIVIKPVVESSDNKYRPSVKSVAAAYLLRKGGSEFN